MKIDQIKIENFKQIEDVTINLASVNYLVGGNNAGKSSILQGIHMAVSCAKLSVERGEAVVPESELRYSPTSEFTSLGHVAPYENKKDGSRGRFEFIGSTADESLASYKIEIYKGRNYGNVGVERSGVYPNFGQIIVDPKKLFSIYVPGLSGIPHREEYKSYASVFQKAAGGDANLVFRNVIRLLKDRDHLAEVESLMSELVGSFSLRMKHEAETDTYLKIEASIGDGKFVPLDLIGTGVIQLLQIVSYVALFKPAFLLIDEPDNHLHPSRQAVLSKAFDKIAKDYGATVIVSTHSRHLIASAPKNSKIIWMKDGRVESDDCRDLATVMIDLGALDQLDSKGAQCIICTEDKGKSALNKALSHLNLDDVVKVISYNGINNAGSAVAIHAMCDLFPEKPLVVIHRDRDFLNEDELNRWGDEYIKRGMFIFSPPFCDVEAYHCTPHHISQVYEVDEAQAKALHTGIIADNAEMFRNKFREKRREAVQKLWRDGGGPATDDLWPENAEPEYHNIYGKKLLSLFNDAGPKTFGSRRDLLSSVSTEFADCLAESLAEIGVKQS
ncbi:MAG: AAA family ATPase [Sphingomonadales bacterium]|nr:AAA family ATPase [Sphingomonadales bacterium]